MFGAVLFAGHSIWLENDYIANRVEPWMHVVAIGFPLSTGVAGLDLFNPAETFALLRRIHVYAPKVTGQGPTIASVVIMHASSSLLGRTCLPA
jgi:hypothetical protein